jgi:hypothetical protein
MTNLTNQELIKLAKSDGTLPYITRELCNRLENIEPNVWQEATEAISKVKEKFPQYQIIVTIEEKY